MYKQRIWFLHHWSRQRSNYINVLQEEEEEEEGKKDYHKIKFDALMSKIE